MFCYQCEQTAKGTGCTAVGVCGKDGTTAALQDLLVDVVKRSATVARAARDVGIREEAVDLFLLEGLFTTVTNVNFDPARIADIVRHGVALAHGLAARLPVVPTAVAEALDGLPEGDQAALEAWGEAVGLARRFDARGPDVTGLEELCVYGLKGMAAYADHAWILGARDVEVLDFFVDALDRLTRPLDLDALTTLALEIGRVNLQVMALLDGANTGRFGHPTPTAVRVTPKAGKCILVSGHDLLDLEALLQQTEGTGIQVWTHGEMLPAHGYPGLRKYPHLAGNYGGAWQDQRKEFDAFPGAILMTTNCIQKPKESYEGRIFTTGLVAWPGVTHLPDRDFRPLIEAALAAPGFSGDAGERTILVGFGHAAVLGVADKVVQAVKDGHIRHFFLVGGCDGARSGRNYYTDFVQATPDDTVVLTLACGKYRFNHLDLGDIGGIPRLLDIGQCNDAYSAIVIASALANAFDTDVNGLPLSLVLSWYEQKAVCILLTLLHLGIRDIRLGPSLPAFVTPPVLQVLVDTFGIRPIATVEEDLAATLG